MNQQKSILAVDDEANMRRLLEISLKQAGYKPLLAEDGYQAISILRSQGADLVVTDLHMPGMDGLRLLETMRQEGVETPVIIVTAQGEVSSAVKAMKAGASDYILRPFDLETLEIAIDRALSISRLKLENQFLREASVTQDDRLVGETPAMLALKAAIRQVAPEKATVLLSGETGTGKEVVARTIHQLSPRNKSLFVAVNCAAIPADILESELFGHERGAFTGAIKEKIGKFELADGGTLFLDEITEMPIGLQAKLLRALQEGVIERLGGHRAIPVDIRVIAATNRNPIQAIQDQKLREDLYYRLNVFGINLPPLRDRPDDIPLLASNFLNAKSKTLSTEALMHLQRYSWPGNVRELQNILERAAIVCGSTEIKPQDLPLDLISSENKQISDIPHCSTQFVPYPDETLPDAIKRIELIMIQQALEKSNGNKSRAARYLEISERSLWYKLDQHKLKTN